MHNYKIVIEYDGTNFVGWQQQENGQSIQSALQEALVKLSNEKVTIFGAGRTDAGVHAKYFCAHFDYNKQIRNKKNLLFKLNSYLGEDIVIRNIHEVSEFFHARFDAISRSYEYFLTISKDCLIAES